MESPSFVVSLNSLVNSFFTFQIKLPPEMKSDRDFKQRSADPNNPVGSEDLKSEISPLLTSPVAAPKTADAPRYRTSQN